MQFTHPRAQETVIKLQRLPKDVPHPNRQEWGRISLPTLILANHSDPLHPFKIAETLAAAIPGARLLEITSKSVSREKHLAEARAYITEFLHQFTC
jgi:pimeloyl-ACP methyl ester carboxylesterase